MGKSKLRLDRRRALDDGTYPVQIGVGYSTDLYLPTGIYLRPDEWNDATRTCVGKNARKINDVLAALLLQVQNRILDLRLTGTFQKLTKRQLREMLTNLDLTSPTDSGATLGAVFARVLETKKGSTRTSYEQTLKKVTAFCVDPYSVHLDSLTKAWVESFERSLSSLAVNSRSLYLQRLHSVILTAIVEGLTTNDPFKRYHVKHEETEFRALPIEKFRQIVNAPLEGSVAESRDLFVLIFLLIGINAKDLFGLTPNSYKDGRISYRRAKTGKLYSIKVEPEAAAIIERYGGSKKHIVSLFDAYPRHSSLVDRINYDLKSISADGLVRHGAGRVPVEPRLSTYWARHSWATYAAELDIPRDTISECLGHKYGHDITGVYIKFSRDKIDAANRRVIDYALGLNV